MQEQAPQSWPDQPRSPRSNVLGIVGFVLSFCLSPIGLILSLVALAKPPRGFAIAGCVIGLLGTIGWVLVCLAIFSGGGAMVKGIGLGMDHAIIQEQLTSYAKSHNGEAPADLVTAGVPESARKDPWDHEYRYERGADNVSWTLTSSSFDGQFGTADDFVLRNNMSTAEVRDTIGKGMEAHFKNGAGSSPAPQPPQAPAEEKKPE